MSVTPGQGPFTVQTTSTGVQMIDGTGAVLFSADGGGNNFTLSSSYLTQNWPVAPPASLPQGQPTNVGSGIVVTQNSSSNATYTQGIDSGYGSTTTTQGTVSSQYFISKGGPNTFTFARNTLSGGGSGCGTHVCQNGIGGCAAATAVMIAAMIAVIVAFAAAAGEAGINPFADVAFWAAFTAFMAAWENWVERCGL